MDGFSSYYASSITLIDIFTTGTLPNGWSEVCKSFINVTTVIIVMTVMLMAVVVVATQGLPKKRFLQGIYICTDGRCLCIRLCLFVGQYSLHLHMYLVNSSFKCVLCLFTRFFGDSIL